MGAKLSSKFLQGWPLWVGKLCLVGGLKIQLYTTLEELGIEWIFVYRK